MGQNAGAPIVLTAPLSIDYAGFFIQISLASIPGWMEWVIDKKHPTWRDAPTTAHGCAGTAPAGLRVLEAVLAQRFGADQMAVCQPDQMPEFIFIGERFGIDTVVRGRAERADVVDLFRRALDGERLPRALEARHPHAAGQLLVPPARTSFGVIEMTTGCGRRCAFCQPDLNPRISVPKARASGHGRLT